MNGITLDILGFIIRVETDCPCVLARLRDIAIHKPLAGPSGSMRFRIPRDAGGGYRVTLDGESVSVPNDIAAVLLLHEWIDREIIARTSSAVWLHAGSFTLGGRGFIVPGEKGAGKTTLLCALALAGVTVHGDEYVALLDGTAVPYPRKFHLKERTLDAVPALRPVYGKLTVYPAFGGGEFVFFDPEATGYPWEMAVLRSPVIVYLDPDHGGETSIRSCPVQEMFGRVLSQVISCPTGIGSAARDLYSFLSSAERYVLTLGSPGNALKIFRELAR